MLQAAESKHLSWSPAQLPPEVSTAPVRSVTDVVRNGMQPDTPFVVQGLLPANALSWQDIYGGIEKNPQCALDQDSHHVKLRLPLDLNAELSRPGVQLLYAADVVVGDLDRRVKDMLLIRYS